MQELTAAGDRTIWGILDVERSTLNMFRNVAAAGAGCVQRLQPFQPSATQTKVCLQQSVNYALQKYAPFTDGWEKKNKRPKPGTIQHDVSEYTKGLPQN